MPSPGELRLLAAVYGWAVLLNYPWELLQAPLFERTPGPLPGWIHCFLASLGDGVLVLAIYAVGRTVFGRREWFATPGVSPYFVTAASGLLLAVIMEWLFLHVFRSWTYSVKMPVVPLLGVGASPLVQMAALPFVAFRLAAIRLSSNRVRG